MTTQLKIEGMTCGHCAAAVRGALLSVPGISEATVSLEEGIATVRHEQPLNSAAASAAVEEEGYAVRGFFSRQEA